jgi:hypothetical protein
MKAFFQFLLGAAIPYHVVSLQADTYAGPDSFDFTHINLAIQYHETPSNDLLKEISETTGAIHLKRHSDRTGYYPATATARSITDDLMANSPSPETLHAVKELILYVDRNPDKQRECMAIASSYLPDEAQPVNALHVTWGYDIGVAMDDHASLNFTHPHFLTDPQETWFYCIHEGHHSGVMQVHPMPLISDIDTVLELYEFVKYATFLEGLAVHSAKEARRVANALGSDNDYLALADAAALARILDAYRERLSYLQAEIGRPLHEDHWQVVEEMSSGARLWYVAGAAMAASIEKSQGRPGLLKVTMHGPEAFFDAYERLEVEKHPVEIDQGSK